MDWKRADDIQKTINHIISVLELSYIDQTRIFCYRSEGSKARAYARTWGYPKIFQDALNIKPAYVIEVLSHHFDKLSEDEKKKVLIHELLHIPRNFSGALVPHRTRHGNLRADSNSLYKKYIKTLKNI